MIQPKMQIKNFKSNLWIAVFSLVFALVVAELFLRSFKIIRVTDQSNAKLVYDHSEGFTKYKKNLLGIPFSGIRFSTNEFGYRDTLMTLEKEADTFRIAFLGDSWGMGWGLEENFSIPKVLQNNLRAYFPNHKIEVLNFSVSSSNMDNHNLIFLKDILRFDIDYLILLVHLNDIDIDANAAPPEQALISLPKLAENLLTYRLLYSSVLLPLAIKFNLPNPSVIYKYRQLYKDSSRHFETYQLLLSSFLRKMKSSSVPAHTFILPLPIAAQNPYPLIGVNDKIKSVVSREGIAVYDLTEVYQQFPQNQLTLHTFDVHPNKFASERIAGKIVDVIAPDISPLLKNKTPSHPRTRRGI